MLAARWMPSLTFALVVVLAACWPGAVQGRRELSRAQRQTATGELASGLTGTGISFNSLYNDPYSQQSIYNQPYDDYAARPSGFKGANSYGIYGSYGSYGGLGGATSGQYDAPLAGGGANFNGLGGLGGGWSGFGAGKHQRGRQPATSGVKY